MKSTLQFVWSSMKYNRFYSNNIGIEGTWKMYY